MISPLTQYVTLNINVVMEDTTETVTYLLLGSPLSYHTLIFDLMSSRNMYLYNAYIYTYILYTNLM